VTCPITLPTLNWVNERASSLGITGFSSEVFIDVAFTVDVPVFTFANAEVAIRSGAIIHVLSGNQLRINESVLTNFGDLWQGIVLEPGATLLVDNSSICGAVLAVQANNDPLFSATVLDIRASLFKLNYENIRISNQQTVTPYPAYVVGNHFEGGPLMSSLYTQTVTGIVVTDVGDASWVMVGDAASVADENLFTDMERGIDLVNSNALVFNNSFERMSDYGVHAIINGPYVAWLRVGSSTDLSNRMTDCRVGVYARLYDSVQVSDNVMVRDEGLFERGIEMTYIREGIIIGENELRDFSDRGIYLHENPAPGGSPDFQATVNSNTLLGPALPGVRGVDVFDIGTELRVRRNDIRRVHRGITVNQAPAGTQVRVDSNLVRYRYLTADGLSPAAGIVLQAVNAPLVYHNTIGGNCAAPCSVPTATTGRIRGMQLFATSDARVFSNYLEEGGAGLYILQANTSGNAVCNQFHDTYSGVVWDLLPTGGFGIPLLGTFRVIGAPTTIASDNTWTSSLPAPFEPIRSFSINGSLANTVQWYHRSAATFDFPAGTNLFAGGTPLSPIVGSPSSICDSLAIFGESAFTGGGSESDFGGGDSSAELSEAWESLLDAESSWDNPSLALYRYLEQAYHQGLAHPKVEAALDRTQIRELAGLKAAWRSADIDGASSILYALSPTNATESGLQQLWQIRLAAEQEGRPGQYSSDELEVLHNWAVEDAWQTGSAWVMDQGMLGRSELPGVWNLESEIENRLALNSTPVILYPNPAQDIVFVAGRDQASALIITDMQGRVWVREAVPAQEQVAISVAELPVDLYLVELRFLDGQVTHRDKLYIQR
jgi:hypothetical protein